MYTFKFTYPGGKHQEYEHITRIEYNSSTGPISVSGDNILSFEYPLDFDLRLFTDYKSYKIPHNGLKSIKAEKEKS